MASSSTTTKTSGSVWTDIAVGPRVLTEVAATNVSALDSRVALRLMRGNEAIEILPGDLLPPGKGFRPRLPAFVLESVTHKLQAMTSGVVDWIANAADLISARQVSRTAKASGDSWVTIWSGLGTISSLMVANASVGSISVSVRIMGPAGSLVLVPPEVIEDGGSRRKIPVATLKQGESLQVKSIGDSEWIAFGVLP